MDLSLFGMMLPCPPLAGCKQLSGSPIDTRPVPGSDEDLCCDEASLHFIRFRAVFLGLEQNKIIPIDE